MGLRREYSLAVRPYDVEFGNVVGTAAYLRWMDDVRHRMMSELVPLEDLVDSGIGMIATGVTLEQAEPLRLLDRPWAEATLAFGGSFEWEMTLEVCVPGGIAARARQHGHFIDLETDESITTPAHVREVYARLELK